MSLIGKISQRFFGGLYSRAGAMEPNFEDSSDKVIISEVVCELHKFDKTKSLYVSVSDEVKAIISKDASLPNYTLTINDAKDGKEYCQTRINTKMLPTFFHAKRAFTWITFDPETDGMHPMESWSLRFPVDKTKELSKFEKTFLEALYLTSINQTKHDLNSEDKRYVDSAYECEPMEVDDYSESERDDDKSTDYSDSEDVNKYKNAAFGGVYGEDKDIETISKKFNEIKVDNSLLSLSRLHGRSFVVRGNNIGVYTNENENPKLSGIIHGLKDNNKKPLIPGKIMLHDRESGLIMSNPDQPGSLYKLDLDRGVISEKWDIADNSVVKHFSPKSKFGYRTSEQEFLGVTPKSLLTIDPRNSGNKVVDANSMKYSANNKFSCLATTPKGEVAVASDIGVVRLYDKTNIRAKTNLYGSGEPIIGLDTTQDGRYVLATCKTHLLLLDTLMPGTENVTGFTKRMGSNKRDLKRLQLRAEDAVRMKCNISFLPARFSSGDCNECFIVTATGPYVVKWSLKRVNSNKLFDYTITKYNDNVIEDNFLYESPNKIVVALPKTVEFLKRSQLSVPKKVFR